MRFRRPTRPPPDAPPCADEARRDERRGPAGRPRPRVTVGGEFGERRGPGGPRPNSRFRSPYLLGERFVAGAELEEMEAGRRRRCPRRREMASRCARRGRQPRRPRRPCSRGRDREHRWRAGGRPAGIPHSSRTADPPGSAGDGGGPGRHDPRGHPAATVGRVRGASRGCVMAGPRGPKAHPGPEGPQSDPHQRPTETKSRGGRRTAALPSMLLFLSSRTCSRVRDPVRANPPSRVRSSSRATRT